MKTSEMPGADDNRMFAHVPKVIANLVDCNDDDDDDVFDDSDDDSYSEDGFDEFDA